MKTPFSARQAIFQLFAISVRALLSSNMFRPTILFERKYNSKYKKSTHVPRTALAILSELLATLLYMPGEEDGVGLV